MVMMMIFLLLKQLEGEISRPLRLLLLLLLLLMMEMELVIMMKMMEMMMISSLHFISLFTGKKQLRCQQVENWYSLSFCEP